MRVTKKRVISVVGLTIGLSIGGLAAAPAGAKPGFWNTKPLELSPAEWQPPAYAAGKLQLTEQLRAAYQAEYSVSLRPGYFVPVVPARDSVPLGLVSDTGTGEETQ